MSQKDPKSTTTTTRQTFSPEETAARNKLFQAGSSAFDEQDAAIRASGNPAAAPVGFSPASTQAQQMLTQYATGGAAQGADAMAGAVNYGLNGAMDVNNNPHLQGAMDAAMRGITRNYTDPNGVLANIRSGSVNNGAYGGTRQGIAEGVAAGRYATELGDVASTMASNAYDKGQDTFARTLAFAPSAIQAGAMPAQFLSAVGGQQEAYGQSLSDYEAAGRAFELNKPFASVANYANLINGIQAPGTTATNSSATSAGGKAMGAIGGGLSGAAAGAMFGPIGASIGGGLGILASLF